ncbi:hypothetical protein AAC387_Pa08g2449 [Persea americana]
MEGAKRQMFSQRSAGCYMRPWGDNGFRSNTTTLENTTFAVDFYSSAESRNKEDCMEACRMDVFCVVALFDYYCYKLKLPLRKNIELEVDDNEIILTEWIYKCYEAGELSKLLLDNEEVEKRQMERIIKVGLCCIQGEPDLRPSMKNVIWMIEGLMDVHVPPLPTA